MRFVMTSLDLSWRKLLVNFGKQKQNPGFIVGFKFALFIFYSGGSGKRRPDDQEHAPTRTRGINSNLLQTSIKTHRVSFTHFANAMKYTWKQTGKEKPKKKFTQYMTWVLQRNPLLMRLMC